MDNESIEILLKIKEKLNHICYGSETCSTCRIKKFEKKYDTQCNSCIHIYMIQHLLGDNEDAADFYKEEIKRFINMCRKTKCKECEITKLKIKHDELKKLDCVVTYFALKLLKDV